MIRSILDGRKILVYWKNRKIERMKIVSRISRRNTFLRGTYEEGLDLNYVFIARADDVRYGMGIQMGGRSRQKWSINRNTLTTHVPRFSTTTPFGYTKCLSNMESKVFLDILENFRIVERYSPSRFYFPNVVVTSTYSLFEIRLCIMQRIFVSNFILDRYTRWI